MDKKCKNPAIPSIPFFIFHLSYCVVCVVCVLNIAMSEMEVVGVQDLTAIICTSCMEDCIEAWNAEKGEKDWEEGEGERRVYGGICIELETGDWLDHTTGENLGKEKPVTAPPGRLLYMSMKDCHHTGWCRQTWNENRLRWWHEFILHVDAEFESMIDDHMEKKTHFLHLTNQGAAIAEAVNTVCELWADGALDEELSPGEGYKSYCDGVNMLECEEAMMRMFPFVDPSKCTPLVSSLLLHLKKGSCRHHYKRLAENARMRQVYKKRKQYQAQLLREYEADEADENMHKKSKGM